MSTPRFGPSGPITQLLFDRATSVFVTPGQSVPTGAGLKTILFTEIGLNIANWTIDLNGALVVPQGAGGQYLSTCVARWGGDPGVNNVVVEINGVDPVYRYTGPAQEYSFVNGSVLTLAVDDTIQARAEHSDPGALDLDLDVLLYRIS